MKVTISVADWGPRETEQGKSVNCQPDGSSAIWIRANLIEKTKIERVRFGEYLWRPATIDGLDLITAHVPECIIQKAGSYPVFFICSKGISTYVGRFRVRAIAIK